MLKVGYARVDVTPPLGTFLSGYYEPRYAERILDPIELVALALGDGEETSLIITADFLGMKNEYADAYRKKVAARTGVSEDHIMISCLHQHTSICLRIAPNNNVMEDADYLNLLERKFCDVAQMALADMSEATFGVAQRETAKELSFVRRYFMKDGTLKTNPGGEKYVGQIVGPAEKSDNNVRLIRFQREGKKDIAFVNFSTHPDVIGGSSYSADWPGFVRRFVEKDIENTCCMLLNGCQGDTNHINFMLPTEEERFPKGKRYPHSEYMGRTIADTVIELWDKTTPMESCKIGGAITTVYNKTRTDGEEFFDECWDMYERRALKGDMSLTHTASGIEKAECYRIVEIRTVEPLYQKVRVTALRLGDVVFVGFGGEPFTNYATAVRELFPDKFIIASCCANGYQNYLPTKLAFEQGGYEVVSTPFTSDLEEDCVAAAKELIEKI